MSNETVKDKTTLLKILPYITAGALACFFIIKNAGFFRYVFEPGIITHIWPGALFNNLIATPALLAVFLAVMWFLGNRILFLLKAGDAVGEYRLEFSIAAGAGVLNLILIGFGAAGILSPFAIKILIAVLFAAAFFLAVIQFKSNNPAGTKPLTPDCAGWAVSSLIYYILFCGVVSALSPPSSWDSLSYHLPIAKQYLEAKRMFVIPSLVQHQGSIGMEMLTAAALSFNNDMLAQLLPLAGFAVTLRIIYIFIKKRTSQLTGTVAAALFAALPASMYLMGKVNNDYFLAMFSTAAVVSLIEFKKTGQKELLEFMLISAGFAVNAKLSGLITALIVVLVVAYWILKKIVNIKNVVLPVAVFAVIASATLARNFIFTGNPVFPMFYRYLGGKGISSENYKRQSKVNLETTSLKPSPKNFLLLPYFLIKDSGRFQNQPRYFVALIIILFLTRFISVGKPDEDEAYLLYFAAGYTVIWFFAGRHIWRFMLPALPAAVMLALIWMQKTKRAIGKITAGAAIAFNFAPVIDLSVNNNLFVVFALPSKMNPGLSPKENYLSKTLDNYDTNLFINRNTGKNSKILLFGEYRSYYIERDYMVGDPITQAEIKYSELNSSGEIGAAMKKFGITHIIVNYNICPMSPSYYDAQTIEKMQKYITDNCKITYNKNNVFLCEIKS